MAEATQGSTIQTLFKPDEPSAKSESKNHIILAHERAGTKHAMAWERPLWLDQPGK